MQEVKFTLSGALEAKRMIDNCFDQSLKGFRRAIDENNDNRKIYWFQRTIHFHEQSNWIENELKKTEAEEEDGLQ